MRTLELKQASKALAEYASQLGPESIVITSNKKPVAALVPLEGVERETLSLSLNPAFLKIIRRSRAEARRGEVHSLDEVKQELLTKSSRAKKPSRGTQGKVSRR